MKLKIIKITLILVKWVSSSYSSYSDSNNQYKAIQNLRNFDDNDNNIDSFRPLNEIEIESISNKNEKEQDIKFDFKTYQKIENILQNDIINAIKIFNKKEKNYLYLKKNMWKKKKSVLK